MKLESRPETLIIAIGYQDQARTFYYSDGLERESRGFSALNFFSGNTEKNAGFGIDIMQNFKCGQNGIILDSFNETYFD